MPLSGSSLPAAACPDPAFCRGAACRSTLSSGQCRADSQRKKESTTLHDDQGLASGRQCTHEALYINEPAVRCQGRQQTAPWACRGRRALRRWARPDRRSTPPCWARARPGRRPPEMRMGLAPARLGSSHGDEVAPAVMVEVRVNAWVRVRVRIRRSGVGASPHHRHRGGGVVDDAKRVVAGAAEAAATDHGTGLQRRAHGDGAGAGRRVGDPAHGVRPDVARQLGQALVCRSRHRGLAMIADMSRRATFATAIDPGSLSAIYPDTGNYGDAHLACGYSQ